MDKRKKTFFLLALIFYVFFLIFLFQVLFNGFFKQIDHSLNQNINLVQVLFFNEISRLLVNINDTVPIFLFTLIILLFLYKKGYTQESYVFAFFMIVNAASIYLLKILLAIPRPLNNLITGQDFSFPSGHTASAFFFFGYLFYLSYMYMEGNIRKIMLVIFSLLPFIIGFSRIYIGVHWFTDVMGGAMLGLFWLAASLFTRIVIKKKP